MELINGRLLYQIGPLCVNYILHYLSGHPLISNIFIWPIITVVFNRIFPVVESPSSSDRSEAKARTLGTWRWSNQLEDGKKWTCLSPGIIRLRLGLLQHDGHEIFPSRFQFAHCFDSHSSVYSTPTTLYNLIKN